ncbi:MAG: hypothetical protein AAF958_03620 [Planctomycetota bacterium]
MPATASGDLLPLYETQWDCLQQIWQYCQQQSQHIDAGDLGPLMRLLSDKNRPVDALRRCTGQITKITGGGIDWQADAPRDTVLALKERCDQLGDDILKLEADCEARLLEAKHSASTALQQLDQRRGAAGAYLAQAASIRGDDAANPLGTGANASPLATGVSGTPSGTRGSGGQLDLQSE